MRLKVLLLCIATFGFAGSIDGAYVIKDPAGRHVGSISISQRSPSSLMFSIGAYHADTLHLCEPITSTAKKIGNIWRYYDNLHDEIYLQLDFKFTGDIVTVASKNSHHHCGRGVIFDDTYVKSKQQTFDESKPELTDKEYIAIKKSVEEYAKADSELSKAYKKL